MEDKGMSEKYILYNALAGNGKCSDDVRKLAEHYKKSEGESPVMVDMAKLESYGGFFDSLNDDDEVVVCGGDGTLNRFVNDTNGIDIKNKLFYYASGSGNDFARDIGHGARELPEYEINSYISRLPSVTVNGRTCLFLNNVGYGIDGYCCEEGDRIREKNERTHKNKPINYTVIAIKGLVYAFKPRNAVVTVDGVEHRYRKVWLAPTMNGRYYGGGMMATPGQDRMNSEHKVSVMVFSGKGKLFTLSIFPTIFKGTHTKYSHHVRIFEGNEVNVSFDRPTPLQIDGETVLGVKSYTVKTR